MYVHTAHKENINATSYTRICEGPNVHCFGLFHFVYKRRCASFWAS